MLKGPLRSKNQAQAAEMPAGDVASHAQQQLSPKKAANLKHTRRQIIEQEKVQQRQQTTRHLRNTTALKLTAISTLLSVVCRPKLSTSCTSLFCGEQIGGSISDRVCVATLRVTQIDLITFARASLD